MKYLSILGLFLLLSIHANAQTTAPSIKWLSAIHAEIPYGFNPMDITVEPGSGNIYVTGRCEAACSFANGTIAVPNPTDGYVFVVLKFDPQGSLLWAKNIGSFGTIIYALHITAATSGGLYICSTFRKSTINFGNGVSVTNSCGNVCGNIFILKLDGNGTAQWASSVFGGINKYFNVRGIEEKASGKLLIASQFEGSSVTFSPTLAFTNLPPNSFFLAEYDANTGAPLDVQFLAQATGESIISNIKTNKNGQTAIFGGFSESITFANGLSFSAPGTSTGFVGLLDDHQVPIWIRTIKSNVWGTIHAIRLDEDGNLYLPMTWQGDVLLDSVSIATVPTEYAGFVLKLNKTSHQVMQYIKNNNFIPYVIADLVLDEDKNIYTSGLTYSDLEINNETYGMDGCTDALITAMDSTGNFLWARTIGGTGCEEFGNYNYASNLAIGAQGNLYAYGTFYNGFNEDGFSIADHGGVVTCFETKTSAAEEPENQSITIFPNPNTGDFSLDLGAEAINTGAMLQIHNLDGKMVYQKLITQKTSAIDSDLPAGTYVVTVQNATQVIREKIIILH